MAKASIKCAKSGRCMLINEMEGKMSAAQIMEIDRSRFSDQE